MTDFEFNPLTLSPTLDLIQEVTRRVAASEEGVLIMGILLPQEGSVLSTLTLRGCGRNPNANHMVLKQIVTFFGVHITPEGTLDVPAPVFCSNEDIPSEPQLELQDLIQDVEVEGRKDTFQQDCLNSTPDLLNYCAHQQARAISLIPGAIVTAAPTGFFGRSAATENTMLWHLRLLGYDRVDNIMLGENTPPPKLFDGGGKKLWEDAVALKSAAMVLSSNSHPFALILLQDEQLRKPFTELSEDEIERTGLLTHTTPFLGAPVDYIRKLYGL